MTNATMALAARFHLVLQVKNFAVELLWPLPGIATCLSTTS
ncbi:MAG: hypothetical protein WA159_18900 [Variovorax sp.]